MPVESSSQCSPTELGRYATSTFRLRCLWHSVLKSGTDHCSPDKASGLSQDRAKQVLDSQAERDSGIRELRAAPAFAVDSGKPWHALVHPNSQGATHLE